LVDISYTHTGISLRNTNGLLAAPLSHTGILNISQEPSPTLLQVYSSVLTVEYNSNMDYRTIPDISQYVVTVDGSPVALSGASLGADSGKIRIFLKDPVNPGQAVRLSYAKTPGIALKDLAGNIAANISDIIVNNSTQGVVSVSSCASIGSYGVRYELTTDLTSAGDCFNIPSSVVNVTLDCKGHKITGNGTGNGVNGSYGNGGFTLQNCEIVNFDKGIAMNIHSYSTNVIFNNFHNNVTGIWYGHHCYNPAIYGNSTTNNSSYGIALTDHNIGSVITHNTTLNNGIIGIFVQSSGTPGAVVHTNTSTNNPTCNYMVDYVANFTTNQ
jgi:Putative flagellar system-associated repeat